MKILLRVTKVLVPFALAAVILYLVFRNVDFAEFFSNLSQVNYWWVFLSIILSIVAYLARAYRWNILLRPVGYHVKIYPATLIILVAYLANLALPRVGELIRCSLLKRYESIPINVSLGTVISERIADVLGLLILLVAALLLEFDILTGFLMSALDIEFGKLIPLFAGAFLIAGMAVLAMVILWRTGRLPEKVKNFLIGMRDGMISVTRLENKMGFVVSTAVLWIVYYLMSYTIIFSLPATSHLDMTAGLMLLVVGGIAIALPVQSGFGTYHAMVAGLLLIYEIEETTGLFLATLLHTSQIVSIAFFGIFALILLPLTVSRLELVPK